MKKEMEMAGEKKQAVARRNWTKGAALALMFTLGTSAFADKGSLFDSKTNNYDMKAVDDIVNIVDFVQKNLTENGLNESAQAKVDGIRDYFDTKYGEGSMKFVMVSMSDYSKTPGGMMLQKSASENGINPVAAVADHCVRKAADRQKMMKSFDMTLADYDYEHGR